ncbi:MAG: helix-turn-helix domain-containing protein [Cycloclasticus sp.]
MDQHTLRAKKKNIKETLITSQHISGSDIHNVSMGMEAMIQSEPLTTYHLFSPIKGKIYSHNSDVTVLPNEFLIIPPSCKVDVTWERLTQAITITLDPASLKEYFNIHSKFPSKNSDIKLSPTSNGATAITSLINYINSTNKGDYLLMESIEIQRNCENLLFEALALSLPELRKIGQAQVLPHSIKQAIEYIEENIQNSITMNDLVNHTGISRRSLEINFSKFFHLSPMKFISNKKLGLIRNTLIKSSPKKTSVIEIAEKFGFQHASHFSMLYQRLYSEKPSETLKN